MALNPDDDSVTPRTAKRNAMEVRRLRRRVRESKSTPALPTIKSMPRLETTTTTKMEAPRYRRRRRRSSQESTTAATLTEHCFIRMLGVSLDEVAQRLVTDEILHSSDARQVHRLLASDDPEMRDAVLDLERRGGSSSRAAVETFRQLVFRRLGHRIRRRDPTVKEVPKTPQLASPPKCHGPKSPLMASSARIFGQGVPVIENVRASLAHRVIETTRTQERPKVVLVGRGKYNPIHRMHLRRFVIARQYLEEHTRFSVLGGLIIPKHATEVRQRLRTTPKEIIPSRHRLGLARAAVGASPWLTVDPWDITRRRILDYLSALDHIRSLFADKFPDVPGDGVRLVFLVSPVELLRLNLDELKDAGNIECITICRPQEHERLRAQLGRRWSHLAHVVEDQAVLSADLEKTTTAHIRRQISLHGANAIHHDPTVASMLPAAVKDYFLRHKLADKISGVAPWTKWDKSLGSGDGDDDQDRGYRRQPKKFPVHESTSYIKI